MKFMACLKSESNFNDFYELILKQFLTVFILSDYFTQNRKNYSCRMIYYALALKSRAVVFYQL